MKVFEEYYPKRNKPREYPFLPEPDVKGPWMVLNKARDFWESEEDRHRFWVCNDELQTYLRPGKPERLRLNLWKLEPDELSVKMELYEPDEDEEEGEPYLYVNGSAEEVSIGLQRWVEEWVTQFNRGCVWLTVEVMG